VDDLLFLHKIHNSRLLQVSADGVLKFSRLIASGLATFSLIVDNTWYDFPICRLVPPDVPLSERIYSVCLTEKGLMLVEAWLGGDRPAIERALAQRQ
jgi:hypothetical protein